MSSAIVHFAGMNRGFCRPYKIVIRAISHLETDNSIMNTNQQIVMYSLESLFCSSAGDRSDSKTRLDELLIAHKEMPVRNFGFSMQICNEDIVFSQMTRSEIRWHKG
jgi:hypothetical protein